MADAYHVILSTSDNQVHEYEFPAADAPGAISIALDQLEPFLQAGVLITHAHARPAGFAL